MKRKSFEMNTHLARILVSMLYERNCPVTAEVGKPYKDENECRLVNVTLDYDVRYDSLVEDILSEALNEVIEELTKDELEKQTA
ncbi:MAG: hypothetical protein IJZ86_01145 [Bacteroides sp.]|nr:hypothetical protein [Bacteroides sp.]